MAANKMRPKKVQFLVVACNDCFASLVRNFCEMNSIWIGAVNGRARSHSLTLCHCLMKMQWTKPDFSFIRIYTIVFDFLGTHFGALRVERATVRKMPIRTKKKSRIEQSATFPIFEVLPNAFHYIQSWFLSFLSVAFFSSLFFSFYLLVFVNPIMWVCVM